MVSKRFSRAVIVYLFNFPIKIGHIFTTLSAGSAEKCIHSVYLYSIRKKNVDASPT